MGTRQLQYYRHDYAKVFMTGVLGCRWHRYQQSTKGSRKRDIIWNIVILLVFLFVTFHFYFWLVADNDRLDFNRYMYDQTGKTFNWFLCLIVIFSTFFAYVSLLMLLSLCHMLHGHQLYTHTVHLVMVIIILSACIAFTVVVQELWESEWSVLFISLQIFGPFLQLGVVACMTLLSCILIKKWFKIARLEWKLGCLFIYVTVMLSLYLSPLLINSPCVILRQNLPRRPKIFAHRGARLLAPENTVIAFERATHYGVYGIETDVRISSDGTPFIMHDRTLYRTTNVAEVYPDLAHKEASNFSIGQLKNLTAGSWFLESDPAGNVNSLTDGERILYKEATVPTFLEVLQLSIKHNVSVMFDLRLPHKSHPYYNTTYSSIVDVIAMSGIDKTNIVWLSNGNDDDDFRPEENYQELSRYPGDVENLQTQQFDGIHVSNYDSSSQSFREYRNNNLTTSVYMVNKVWLYSFYWCVGTDYISTDYCHILTQVETPIWHLSPSTYRIIWVVTDCVSVFIIICIFFIYRYRQNHSMYHPERASLNSQSGNGSTRWGAKRTRRSMKEKLLMRDVQIDPYDFDQEDDLGIDSNGYNATVNECDGRELAQTVHGSLNGRRSERSSCIDGNRSSFISSVESGDLFGGNRLSYLSTGSNPNVGDTTDVFPNGTAEHSHDVQNDYNVVDGFNSSTCTTNSTNTYQTETQFS